MDPTQGCCPNEACPARGQGGNGNITVHRRQQARYRCTGWEKTFRARRGTMCSWQKTPVDMLVLVVTLLAHGCPVRALVAAVGVTAETVRTGAAAAGVHGRRCIVIWSWGRAGPCGTGTRTRGASACRRGWWGWRWR